MNISYINDNIFVWSHFVAGWGSVDGGESFSMDRAANIFTQCDIGGYAAEVKALEEGIRALGAAVGEAVLNGDFTALDYIVADGVAAGVDPRYTDALTDIF